MTVSKFILNSLVFVVCLIASATSTLGDESKRDFDRPNIIFLLADDQNVSSVGCYGNDEVQTPQMDRLAKEGIAFDRHYNTTAICMACRATVMTGLYEYRTGTNFSHGNMKADTWKKSYPILLREAGYFNAFAGKFGFLVDGKGLCKDDFDLWGGGPSQTNYKTATNPSMAAYAKKYPHSTLSYGAFGRDAIRAAKKAGKPLLLSISFKAPHRPVSPDPKFDHVYAGKKFTKPANYGREAGKHMSKQSKQGRQYPRFKEWNYDKNYDEVMAKYYQQVYAIDVAIGMMREELEAQGMADNTVIIYTSDNGFICGAHGYGSKVLPMEESSRVPLIILDPRSSNAGKQLRSESLTGNIDFAPTILELAGLPVPENVDGTSLVPLLKDPTTDIRQQMAFINVFPPLSTSSLTVLTKQLKYTYWWFSNDKMKPTEELFDLKADPLEMTNLAQVEDSAPQLETMRKRYDNELENWKQKAVPYNDYQRFGVLFDRTIPNAEKAKNKRRTDPKKPSKKQPNKKNATNSAAKKKSPNIVLIMADDLGWKDLHCYGNENVDTPNLDRLAKQGLFFTDAYSAAPVCTPTRAALMTGESPARLNITNHAGGHPPNFQLPGTDLMTPIWLRHLPLERVTIAEQLKKAGYATGFVGKWHLSNRRPSKSDPNKTPTEPELRAEHQGFDINIGGCRFGGPPSYFSPYKIPNLKGKSDGEYLPDRCADECIDFIKSAKAKGDPFFLCWWNYSVHYPFQAPKDLIAKYEKRTGPGVENPTYAAMIEGMDTSIGKLLDSIDEQNLSEDTLIIFTSDNGPFDANVKPLRAEKGYLYEGGIRVPMMVRWPGRVKAGQRTAKPVITMDIHSTILEVANLKPDSTNTPDGVSLLPLFEDESKFDRESIYFHYPNYAFHKKNRLGSAIRSGDYKLIKFYDNDSVELYDLGKDISESRNLANEMPEKANQLRADLEKWLEKTNASQPQHAK